MPNELVHENGMLAYDRYPTTDFGRVCGNCGHRRGHHRDARCYGVEPGQELGWARFREIDLTVDSNWDEDEDVAKGVRESNYAYSERGDLGMSGHAVMDQICTHCGLRYGWHRSGDLACPPSSGSGDWSNGPGTFFGASGQYRERAVARIGEPAANLIDWGIVGAPVDEITLLPGTPAGVIGVMPPRAMSEVCGACGQPYGVHAGDDCPPLAGYPSTTFIPTGMLSESDNPVDLRLMAPIGQGAVVTEATWIAVPGQRSWIERLSSMGIPAMAIALADFGGMRCTAFPAADLERVRTLLHVSSQLNTTADPDIVLAWERGSAIEESGPGVDPEASRSDMSAALRDLRTRMAAGAREAAAAANEARVREEAAMATERRATTSAASASEPEPPVHKVYYESRVNMENAERMRPVFQQFADRLKVNIKIINFHSDEWDHKQPPEGTLRVVFWCNPARKLDRINKMYVTPMFGYTLAEGQRDGVEGSQLTDWEIRSHEGEVVAEVMGRTLFILFDLPHGSYSADVLRSILLEYSNGKPTEDAVEIGKQRLFKLVTDLSQARVAKVQESLRSRENTLADYFRHIQEITGQITSDRLFLENAKGSAEAQRDKINREFDRLRNMGNVKALYISGTELFITTNYLPFTHKKRLYQGHEYKIKLIPKIGKIQILSGDKRPLIRGSFAHPHISADGTPCFGNIGKGMFDLLSQLEFAALVQMLMEYLQTANESDWYSDPVQWPKEIEAAVADTGEAATVLTTAPVAPCPGCGGVIGECECWYCEACGNWLPVDDWQCEECGHCENCCGGHDSADDD